MRYVEYSPAPLLRSYIECFWGLSGTLDESRQPERILPDGCMELVFHRGTPFKRCVDGTKIEQQKRGIVVGQVLGPAMLIASGNVEVLGVRFQPGGAYPFFDFPLDQIQSQFLSLEEAFGSWGRQLEQRVLESPSKRAAIQGIEQAFLSILGSVWRRDRVHGLTEFMLKHHGAISVSQMATLAGVTERQLEREFNAAVGLSPKALARVFRFQQVFRAMEENTGWVNVALECGYCDQPHLVTSASLPARLRHRSVWTNLSSPAISSESSGRKLNARGTKLSHACNVGFFQDDGLSPDLSFIRPANTSRKDSLMHIRLLFSLIALLSPMNSAFPQSPAPVDRLAWISGCWEQAGSERIYTEHWMKPAGGLMLGMSRTIVRGKAVEFEFLQIREQGGDVAYVARPSGQSETSFKLVKASDAEAVFENPEHDFPQRIIYRLQGDGTLVARIEGKSNGADRGINFPMKKARCEANEFPVE